MSDDTPTIDTTDFAILKCVHDRNESLWKNKIYESIENRVDELPIVGAISVQTVGRRVDKLADEGLLETGIITPDEIQRDLIIAFKITDKGKQALQDKQDEILKNVVIEKLFEDNRDLEIGKPALVELISDEFHLSESTQDQMLDTYRENELVMLLCMHYMEREAMKVFDEQHMEKFRESVSADQEFRSIY